MPITRQAPSSSLRGPQRGLSTCTGTLSVSGARTQAKQVPAGGHGAGALFPVARGQGCWPHRGLLPRWAGIRAGAGLPCLERVCATHRRRWGPRANLRTPLLLGFSWGLVGRRQACPGPGCSLSFTDFFISDLYCDLRARLEARRSQSLPTGASWRSCHYAI